MNFQEQEQQTKISVVIAKETDIFSILAIQDDCGLSGWTANQYETEITRNGSVLLTAKLGNQTVGFVAARVSGDELDILNFGVFKKFRRRGIGEALFSKLLGEFVPAFVRTVWLEVRESNVSATKFYQKRGFAPVQSRKNFYRRPNENALVMKMSIERDGR